MLELIAAIGAVLLIASFAFTLLMVYALCKVSGKCSRQEETQDTYYYGGRK